MPSALATGYYSHNVPVEVWLMCWSFCSLQQLRRVSLVCKLFRSLVLPELFREETFDVMALAQGLDRVNWMDWVRHLHRTAVRLDRLVEGPFAAWVRTWKVSFGPRTLLHQSHRRIESIHLFDALSDRVRTTFSTTLMYYQKLSTLHIANTAIDSPFRKALHSLPQLKDLLLRDCRIYAGEILRLDSLTITLCSFVQTPGPVQLADPGTLRSLAMDVGPSTVLTVGSATLPNLVDLSIQDIRDAGKLVRFLAQCPQLEALSINSLEGPLPTIPPHVIPRLRSLSAPRAFVHIVAPGRPVSRVIVIGALSEELLIPLCTAISRGTVPLKSVDLSCQSLSFDPLVAIASLFPQLTELSLEYLERIVFRRGFGHNIRPMVGRIPFNGHRPFELHDETAFEGDLPADDISDDEPGLEDPTPILAMEQAASTESFHVTIPVQFWNPFHKLIHGSLTLPADIEILRVADRNYKLPPAEQHQAIARLSRRYTHLREVKFDSLGSSWERTGDLWAREVSGAREVIKIVEVKPDLWMNWSDDWSSSFSTFSQS